MAKLFTILSFPIIVLNLLGGVGGAIWLAILGQWSDVGYGLVAIFLGSTLISFALLPAMAFSFPFIWAIQKRIFLLAYPLGLLSLLWTYAVLTVWCVGWFAFFLSHAHHVLPSAMWAYAVATGPWTYMAAREGQMDPESFSPITAVAAQIGCVIMIVTALILQRLTFLDLAIGFGVPIAIWLCIQVVIMVAMARNESYRL